MAQKFKLPSKLQPLQCQTTTLVSSDTLAPYYPYQFIHDTKGLTTLEPTDDCLGRSTTIDYISSNKVVGGCVYRKVFGEWIRYYANHWWNITPDGKVMDSIRQFEAINKKTHPVPVPVVGQKVISVDLTKYPFQAELNKSQISFSGAKKVLKTIDDIINKIVVIAEVHNCDVVYVQGLSFHKLSDLQEQLLLGVEWKPISNKDTMSQTKSMLQDILPQIEKRMEKDLVVTN